jgi:hypothetical protein
MLAGYELEYSSLLHELRATKTANKSSWPLSASESVAEASHANLPRLTFDDALEDNFPVRWAISGKLKTEAFRNSKSYYGISSTPIRIIR